VSGVPPSPRYANRPLPFTICMLIAPCFHSCFLSRMLACRVFVDGVTSGCCCRELDFVLHGRLSQRFCRRNCADELPEAYQEEGAVFGPNGLSHVVSQEDLRLVQTIVIDMLLSASIHPSLTSPRPDVHRSQVRKRMAGLRGEEVQGGSKRDRRSRVGLGSSECMCHTRERTRVLASECGFQAELLCAC
jgi:hypothetical protein